MSDATLAVAALRQRWHLPEAASPERWQRLLELLAGEVAADCDAAGASLIGHVKVLALLRNGGYVRASALDTRHAPSSEASGCETAGEAELTLNVLVYGLADEVVAGLAGAALTRAAVSAGIEVSECANPTAGHEHGAEDLEKGRQVAMSSALVKALSDLDEAAVLDEVKTRLVAGDAPVAILEDCREGMTLVGERFETGEYFISDLMMAGHVFKQAVELLGTGEGGQSGEPAGVIVMGTVKGDVHDIGKDLVVSLLRAANFAVTDLGIDVPVERFVETVKTTGATVLGLSGLLTTSFDPMRDTVAALNTAGLRQKVKVMIGGGPMTAEVCKYVGADGWSTNAQSAVTMANSWT